MTNKGKSKGSKNHKNKLPMKSREDLSAEKAIARVNSAIIPGSGEDADTTLVTLSLVQAVNSSAAGVINFTLQANPGSYVDWTSYNAVYREYRILASDFRWVPLYDANVQATLQMAPLIHVVDRADPTALPSYALAWNNSSASVKKMSQPFKKIIKLEGIEDAVFSPTSVPVTVWTHKLYADSLSNSLNYGRVFFRVLIQFRGRF